MPKNPINKGDSVVFTQRYQPHHEFHALHDEVGTVMDIINDKANVDFHFLGKVIVVPVTDLQQVYNADDSESVDEMPISPEFMDDHELGGMGKAQLIAYKILAQESDPKLNRDINLLLQTQE